MPKYLVVIEKAGKNYSAFCPDLPGCIATGKSKAEASKYIHEAIEFHLQGLKEDNLPIPEPNSATEVLREQKPRTI